MSTTRELFDAVPEGIKHLLDAVSVIGLLGILVNLLPAIASLLTIVWTTIRIYETRTVQGVLGRHRRGPSDED